MNRFKSILTQIRITISGRVQRLVMPFYREWQFKKMKKRLTPDIIKSWAEGPKSNLGILLDSDIEQYEPMRSHEPNV